jgi:hypothetical protein
MTSAEKIGADGAASFNDYIASLRQDTRREDLLYDLCVFEFVLIEFCSDR